jgi:hypothetical protein
MVTFFEILNNALNVLATTITKGERLKLLKQMETEAKNLPHLFTYTCFSDISPEKIYQTVQYAQTSTSFLLNNLQEQINSEPKNQYQSIENSLYRFLLYLLSFLLVADQQGRIQKTN